MNKSFYIKILIINKNYIIILENSVFIFENIINKDFKLIENFIYKIENLKIPEIENKKNYKFYFQILKLNKNQIIRKIKKDIK